MDSISPMSATFSPMVLSPPPTSPTSMVTFGESFIAMDHESTLLAMAILTGNVRQVEALLHHGATISERHYWLLYQACLDGIEMVRVLMAFPGMDFQTGAEDGDSILHLVLRTPNSKFSTSKADIVELLLRNGADPFVPDRLGETALHILSALPTEEDVELLRAVLSGSSGPLYCLNHQNLYGDTALIIAVICENMEAVKLLLELGADPNIRGEYNATALDYAVQQQNPELAVLTAFGAEAGDMDIGTERG